MNNRDQLSEELTLEEQAEIEAGFDEIERGEYVTLDEVMREVRAIRESRPSP